MADLTENEIKVGEVAYSALKSIAVSALIGGVGAAAFGFSTPVINEKRYSSFYDGSGLITELVNGVVKSRTKM